jgi:2-amino-4-hydroxy-6-hydroxymethyldihydropteridine diphosphokinase
VNGGRIVHIGLGSNLGDRLGNLVGALERLDRTPGVRVESLSHAYETEPVGPPQGEYLNAAACLRTSLMAADLLAAFQAIERSLGRDRRQEERWGPRTIDLDLLLDGESVLEAPGLTVPHPRLAERPFVLEPLAEIAAEARVPPGGRTVASLAAALRSGQPSRVERHGPIPFRPDQRP